MIQFQRLLDVCRATEELPLGGFDMHIVSCGTSGCMIGNYNAMVGRRSDLFGMYRIDLKDWEYFGISEDEYYWIFASGPAYDLQTRYGINLLEVTRTQALSRLRKFIYYKMHKHEMCYDEKYGISERSRRMEGNHHFAHMAVEQMA